MYDLIAIGDIKLDTFVVLDNASLQCQLKVPECLLCMEYGAKIPVSVVDSQIAGSAPNVAVGLSRQGLRTAVISNMGVDGTRDMALKKLAKENVSADFIRTAPKEPSSYSVVLNYKGDRTILTSHIKHAYVLPSPLPKTAWVHVGETGEGYEKLYAALVKRKKRNGIKISFNPGSIQIQERKQVFFDLLSVTDVLFVNREEAQAITGETSIEIHHLAPALLKLGCKEALITDGRNGSYHFDGEKISVCPIFPGDPIETTGAGDSFATGFLGARLAGLDAAEGMRWGSVNAASVVRSVGPTDGLLTPGQIKTRLRTRKTYQVKTL